ncbi:MAG TPA: ABC transporter ATP-binding protein [Candidatus Methylomirabilis sp.]|nr:ABC transporter ATP-binding protein [Candidatus Methylomirabilis sp.]
MGEAPLLEVRSVSKSFGGVQAVRDVSLRLSPREVRAVIGPNGAGKTTLFNLLTGHLACDQGAVLFKGERISGLPPHRIWRLGISRTFQITATFRSLSVLQNVQVAILSHQGRSREMFSITRRLVREPAVELLEQVGLQGLAERACGALSYADLKRLELALALANDPEVLLLDEPTAGMAPQERMDLMALVLRTVAERGLGVLFTEHDMDVVFAAAGRILVLHQGQMISEGTPQEVRASRAVQEIYLGGPAQADGW